MPRPAAGPHACQRAQQQRARSSTPSVRRFVSKKSEFQTLLESENSAGDTPVTEAISEFVGGILVILQWSIFRMGGADQATQSDSRSRALKNAGYGVASDLRSDSCASSLIGRKQDKNVSCAAWKQLFDSVLRAHTAHAPEDSILNYLTGRTCFDHILAVRAPIGVIQKPTDSSLRIEHSRRKKPRV